MGAVDRKAVKSARRVLEVLEYFDQNTGPASVMSIARALEYPQSSTSELLTYLAHLGYLTFDRYKRTYLPTVRVAVLGTSVEPELFRNGHLFEMIDRLSESTGETVLLSGAFNHTIRHIHIRRGHNVGSFNDRIGTGRSLVYSPYGRLLLSTLDDNVIRQILHRANAEASLEGPAVRLQDLTEELSHICDRGYAIGRDTEDTNYSSIVMMLPYECRPNRLMLSIVAKDDVVEAQSSTLVRMMHTASSQLRQLNPQLPNMVQKDWSHDRVLSAAA